MADPRPPKRRLSLTLDMGADSLGELHSALGALADELLREGRERLVQTGGGWASGYHLELTLTDEAMDGDTYRRLLKDWLLARRRQAALRKDTTCPC